MVHSTTARADPLEIIDPRRLAQAGPRDLSDALERGRIVFFRECPIALPTEDEQTFLRERLPSLLRRKNVTLYPDADRLVGVEEAAARARTRQILSAHARRVREFLARSMPELMQGADPGLSSFRPLQERGRNLGVRASNERLHVDAGAYGATHGARILRFFINLNPTEDRVWLTKGSFNTLYARYASPSGLSPDGGAVDVSERVLDKAFSGLVRLAVRAGASMARVVDSSPYDRAMRRFHNFLKENEAFQTDPEGRVEIAFPPFSAWMVFTDGVSHACTSGQFALVDTLLVPLAGSGLPELAPYNVLRSPVRPVTEA